MIKSLHLREGSLTMKNIYFIQVDVSSTLGSQNAYLPYTAGVLAAAAFTDETVKKELCLKEFIFLREDCDTVVARMEEPFIAAFSCYCWNTEYNKLLAEKIKEKYPCCTVVFGGHNVPADGEFLDKYDFIDILSHGEGEETTVRLFKALALGQSIENIDGISFRKDGNTITKPTAKAPELIYPSPYLSGLFDGIIEAHPEITFNAILETSRGCPNRCAYCDWGLLNSKVRLYSDERVEAEIRWMSEHKIAFVWGADANFGLFDRDIAIAEKLAEAKKKTGYPEKMRMNYAKNKFDNVFRIVKIFKECDFDRIGATLSFQSLSPDVLANIGRRNSDIEFYKNLLTRYNSENMKTYSELILGLPGETYESFIKGIGTLFEIGQHFVFDVYSCIMLPNAGLNNKEFSALHGLKTVRSEIIRPHFENNAFAVPEYNEIITETESMSREMWVRCTVFYYFAKAFHGNGLLRAFAVYLYACKGLPYEKFYDSSLDWMENNPDTIAGKMFREIRQHAEELSQGKNNRKLIFAPCGDIVWDDHEYAVLNILEQREKFYEEISPFLRQFGIEDEMFDSLSAYQKAVMRIPCEETASAVLSYDIDAFLADAYVNNLHEPEELKHTLILRDSEVMPDWRSFGKLVIWYGRMGWASYKTVTEKRRIYDC